MSLFSGESSHMLPEPPSFPVLPPVVVHYEPTPLSTQHTSLTQRWKLHKLHPISKVTCERVSFCPSSGVQRPGSMTVWNPQVAFSQEEAALVQGEALPH